MYVYVLYKCVLYIYIYIYTYIHVYIFMWPLSFFTQAVQKKKEKKKEESTASHIHQVKAAEISKVSTTRCSRGRLRISCSLPLQTVLAVGDIAKWTS